LYYDYGACSLEYVFEFIPSVSSAPTADWLASASFWREFRKEIMDAVEHRTLGALQEPSWSYLQSRLGAALAHGHKSAARLYPGPLAPSPDLSRRPTTFLSRWKTALRRPALASPQLGMVPIGRIFGHDQSKISRQGRQSWSGRGHVCASFGINFILFGDHKLGTARTHGLPELMSIVERILGGRPIGDFSRETTLEDYGARSDFLDYVFYGAVHTLVIVRSSPSTEEAAATVAAARSLLRYLWIGYGILADASRGLMALQGEYYLGYPSLVLRRESLIRGMVKDLEVAGQISQLLIAEFHFSMFWESEIEYDIYHPAYEKWRMPELAKFVDDNLTAVAKTADVLRLRIEGRRQRGISWLLGSITALTIITAVNDFFIFSEWKLSFLHVDYPLHEEWKDLVTILVLLIWVVFFVAMFSLIRERQDRR
jgi:hypothetical protein